ncbi:predicted RNA-binding protein YlxR, DUF448 family [Flexilinea flocculi]|uniref:Predicted RNA-binding protein YlxR, DUF448 family n=1 Tax=Flexilinea flocculi TaxID=1678840 RepID=A0A0S7BYG7_9CHLR|nr:predicted RNA-binding protein YlxR, DUF448 family [Flexilinea flocculi]
MMRIGAGKVAKNTFKRSKHVPQRTCIGCREILGKRLLIRLVKTADGLMIDTTGKIPGRGAYLHNKRECWEKALSRGLLAKSLKTELSALDIENMRKWMEEFPDLIDSSS